MHLFKAALSITLLAGSALAQFTGIVLPTPGSTLTAGSQVVVQVSMEDTLENLNEVALVIGLTPYGTVQCADPSTDIGDILYMGPFSPQPGPGYFSENFTVTIPTSVPAGQAWLNVLNLYQVGLGLDPAIEYLNETVTIVA